MLEQKRLVVPRKSSTSSFLVFVGFGTPIFKIPVGKLKLINHLKKNRNEGEIMLIFLGQIFTAYG